MVSKFERVKGGARRHKRQTHMRRALSISNGKSTMPTATPAFLCFLIKPEHFALSYIGWSELTSGFGPLEKFKLLDFRFRHPYAVWYTCSPWSTLCHRGCACFPSQLFAPSADPLAPHDSVPPGRSCVLGRLHCSPTQEVSLVAQRQTCSDFFLGLGRWHEPNRDLHSQKIKRSFHVGREGGFQK